MRWLLAQWNKSPYDSYRTWIKIGILWFADFLPEASKMWERAGHWWQEHKTHPEFCIFIWKHDGENQSLRNPRNLKNPRGSEDTNSKLTLFFDERRIWNISWCLFCWEAAWFVLRSHSTQTNITRQNESWYRRTQNTGVVMRNVKSPWRKKEKKTLNQPN